MLLEACNLVLNLSERVGSCCVGNLVPEFFFKRSVRNRVVTNLGAILCAVTLVVLESLGTQGLFFVVSKVRGGEISFKNLILMVWSELAVELMAINNNLA